MEGESPFLGTGAIIGFTSILSTHLTGLTHISWSVFLFCKDFLSFCKDYILGCTEFLLNSVRNLLCTCVSQT